jgi:hypothetical protein
MPASFFDDVVVGSSPQGRPRAPPEGLPVGCAALRNRTLAIQASSRAARATASCDEIPDRDGEPGAVTPCALACQISDADDRRGALHSPFCPSWRIAQPLSAALEITINFWCYTIDMYEQYSSTSCIYRYVQRWLPLRASRRARCQAANPHRSSPGAPVVSAELPRVDPRLHGGPSEQIPATVNPL